MKKKMDSKKIMVLGIVLWLLARVGHEINISTHIIAMILGIAIVFMLSGLAVLKSGNLFVGNNK